jgi:hypothetical protein
MDSVGAGMRRQMDKTLAGLNDKLGALERQVLGTVRTVKDSVNNVRDTFDVKLQVRRRPWTLLAGATALGFLGGFRSSSRGAGHPTQNGKNNGAPPHRAADDEPPRTGANNGTNAARLSAAVPGWGAKWGGRFQPEISALRGVAVGALLELVRDFVTKPAPQPAAGTVRQADKGSNGKAGVRAAPSRVSTARRTASSRLHPLEGVTDGKTDRRPR